MQHRLKTKLRFAYAEDTVSRITENINIFNFSFFRNDNKKKGHLKYRIIYFLLIYKKENEFILSLQLPVTVYSKMYEN